MRMQHAIAAVRAFAGECQLGPVTIELGAPRDQFLNPWWTFLHQYASGLNIYQSIAGIDGVLQVQADFIFIAEGNRDSTLGILCVRFRDFTLSQAEYFAARC